MEETTTSFIMILLFFVVGVGLPVFLMLKDKTQKSSLPNKLILWISMVFCMALVFGVIADFRQLSEEARSNVIEFGFITIILFGGVFGIDQFLKSRSIESVQWKDIILKTVNKKRDEEDDEASENKRETENG